MAAWEHITEARGLALGDGYLRQGRVDAASAQLDAGMQARTALANDAYGTLIRSALERLEKPVRDARAG